MRILFVIPRNKSLFGGKGLTVHPHIGIAYLASFLKGKGIQVAIFDEGLDANPKQLYRLIQEFKPKLIGITIFSYCYSYAYNLIKLIKAMSEIPIVAGGPHVSAVKEKLLEDTGITFAIKQEGELSLYELLQEMEKENPDFRQVKGLVWSDKDGCLKENPDRDLISDLDALPFPDYNAFGLSRYACYRDKYLPLVTSRGCPFSCNYCSVRLSMGRRFRARSAQNVFREIKYFYARGFNTFEINDDCFTLDRRRAEEVCDLIISDKLDIRFQLYNGIRVDTVDLNLLKKMKKAGCFFISYGCEAGTDKILKVISKGISLSQVRQSIAWTNEVGIRNSVNFIIGHKEETYEDALETLRFAESLPTDFVNFYNLLPYPGTESYVWVEQHAKFLVPTDSFLEKISYRDNQPIFETSEFTKEQREKVINLGFELYRKRILTFRLGKICGNFIYWFTKIGWLNRLAVYFALSNLVGKKIYGKLTQRSRD